MCDVCWILIILFTSATVAYRLQCPDISQRLLRASAYCTRSLRWKYTCLYDTNRDGFSEKCYVNPDYVAPGEKYVVTRNLRNIDCFEVRFQPFPLWSNTSGECLYHKSWCVGEGQVINNNGSTISDRTCRCDYTKGYKFIQQPKQACFCIPSEEDCSCYISKCVAGSTLSSDYECVIKKENDDSKCPSIDDKSTLNQDIKEEKVNITLVNSIKINLKIRQEAKIGVLIMFIMLLTVVIAMVILVVVLTVDIKHDKRCVAAIDFGTTYSGYAVCKRYDYKKNPNNPKIDVRKWGDGVNNTNKAPTCVLFNQEEKFVSFGYDAMNEFRLNPKEIDYSKWYYFEHFKIKLFKQKDKVTKETMLEESLAIQNSESKKKMYAVDVFAAVISYLSGEVVKEEYMQSDKHNGTKYKLEDIHWVITVPAIWDRDAKLFMKDAARKAGILDKNLTLALEPEAASVYCRRVAVGDSEETDGCNAIAELGIGSKYVVLDQGGGTTDITVYEVTGRNTLKEIYPASGGQWGGITVTAKFNNFLLRLLGNDVITKVKTNNPSDYYQLLYYFEHTKASFTEEHSKLPKENQTLTLPYSWLDHFQRVTGCNLEDTVKQSMYRNKVSVKRDKMRIRNELFRTFFDDSIRSIVQEMQKLLMKKQLEGVKTILVVGGHSKSTILTNAINEEFGKSYKIVIPKNPDIAVMKGAVLFGFNSRMITSRVSQYE